MAIDSRKVVVATAGFCSKYSSAYHTSITKKSDYADSFGIPTLFNHKTSSTDINRWKNTNQYIKYA